MTNREEILLPAPAAGQLLRPGAPGFKVYSEDQLRDYAARWGLACAKLERKRCAEACRAEAASIRSEGEGSTGGQYDFMAAGAERAADAVEKA